MRSGEEHGIGQASRWRTASHGSCGLALMKPFTGMRGLRREGREDISRARCGSDADDVAEMKMFKDGILSLFVCLKP